MGLGTVKLCFYSSLVSCRCTLSTEKAQGLSMQAMSQTTLTAVYDCKTRKSWFELIRDCGGVR